MTGFVIGGLLGVVAGLLLAPKPGQETLEELRVRSEGLRSRGRDLMGDTEALRETVADLKEILKETVQEARQVLQEAVEEGKAASLQATHDLQQRFQESREGR